MTEIDFMNDQYAPQGFEPRALATLAEYLVLDCEVLEIQVQLRQQVLPEAGADAAPFVAYVVFADPEAREENRRITEGESDGNMLDEIWSHYYVFDAGYTKVSAVYDQFKNIADGTPPRSTELREQLEQTQR